MHDFGENRIQNIPKHFQLKSIILDEIKKGNYTPGMQLPSTSELMNKFDISFTTVRRAINELKQEGRLCSIQGKGCFVSDLRDKENRRIAYICPTTPGDKYFNNILNGILKLAHSIKYRVEVYNSGYDYSREIEIINGLIEEPPAGVLISPFGCWEDSKQLSKLKMMGVPIVMVDNDIKGCDFDFVSGDIEEVGKKATEYLISLGHKKIVFLGFIKDTRPSIYLLKGYRRALEEAKLEFDPKMVVDSDVKLKEGESGESGYKGIQSLFAEKIEFSAIFAQNESLTINAYRILKDKGLRIPEDVSVIGSIDPEHTKVFEVPVTAIDSDFDFTGYKAAELLFKRIKENILPGAGAKIEPVINEIFDNNIKIHFGESVRNLK